MTLKDILKNSLTNNEENFKLVVHINGVEYEVSNFITWINERKLELLTKEISK